MHKKFRFKSICKRLVCISERKWRRNMELVSGPFQCCMYTCVWWFTTVCTCPLINIYSCGLPKSHLLTEAYKHFVHMLAQWIVEISGYSVKLVVQLFVNRSCETCAPIENYRYGMFRCSEKVAKKRFFWDFLELSLTIML